MKYETIVIIPTFNGKHLLGTCLDSLRAQTYRDFKVLVVDDASADETISYLNTQYPEVDTYSLPENSGFARAVNAGLRNILKAYRPKYIAVLNNDTRVDPEWLSALVQRMSSAPKTAAVASNMFFAQHPDVINSQGGTLDWNGDGYDVNFGLRKEYGKKEPESVFSACWGAALINTETLEEIGLLDESFGAYFEDLDWSWRAHLFGYDILFEPRAVVLHDHSASYRGHQYRKLYFCKRNALRAALKNYGRRELPRQLGHIFLGYWFSIVGYFQTSKHHLPLPKKFLFVTIPFAALAWNLIRFPQTLILRKNVQKKRKAPDGDIFALAARDATPVREWIAHINPFNKTDGTHTLKDPNLHSRTERFLLACGLHQLHAHMYLKSGPLRYFTGRMHALYNHFFPGKVPETAAQEKVFGVNLFGFLDSESGVGETARSLARVLREVRIPHALINSPHVPHRREEREFSRYFTRHSPYPVNIVAIFGDMLAKEWEYFGPERFKGKYNIAYWAWELETLPPSWVQLLDRFDEVWTISTFVTDAVRRAKPNIPVHTVPLVISVGAHQYGRARFRIRDDAFTFLFLFDFYSSFERKNPLATIRAFKQAFKKEEPAMLVIKCSNSNIDPTSFDLLKREAQGANVKFIDSYLSREEVLSLMNVSDCLVSLHRSEGFGLTLAEAMALQRPVIATNYSGNVDFMTHENSFPIGYHLVPLEKNYGTYTKGNRWAEPNLEEAAREMRFAYENREVAARKGDFAARDIISKYSAPAVGELVHRRLTEIANDLVE